MDASLPADLAQLKARFDHWRKTRTAVPTPSAFFSLSPAVPEAEPPIFNRRPSQDCRLVPERPDGAQMILVAPQLDVAMLGALCPYFLRS